MSSHAIEMWSVSISNANQNRRRRSFPAQVRYAFRSRRPVMVQNAARREQWGWLRQWVVAFNWETEMKLLFVAVAALVSTAAMAQGNDPCKLVSDEKGVKVWQCAPTPVPNTGPPVASSITRTNVMIGRSHIEALCGCSAPGD